MELKLIIVSTVKPLDFMGGWLVAAFVVQLSIASEIKESHTFLFTIQSTCSCYTLIHTIPPHLHGFFRTGLQTQFFKL